MAAVRSGVGASAVGPAELEALLIQRHSCRAFLPDPLPRDTIISILDAAQRAPSWCNTQPWQVFLISGSATDALRTALLEHVDCRTCAACATDFDRPSAYTGQRLQRRRDCAWALYEAVGVKRGDRVGSALQTRENFAFFGAPHVAIVTTPAELGTYGAVDAGLWIATFLYAAQSHGVATIAQAAIASHSPFIRDYFSIPDDHLVLCGISFGWEDETHPANAFRTTRAGLDEVVTWRGGTG